MISVPLIHAALVYDGSLLGHIGMPVVPQPDSLLQYNGVIFIVKDVILNLDEQCFDVHVETIDEISTPISVTSNICLN